MEKYCQDTLDYYNSHADGFRSDTIHASMSALQEEFLEMLPAGGRILDLGCGPGRDTRLFLERGFRVTAVDGSEELCRLAQNYYFKMNDFYPPNADAKDNGDGTFTICLYESICDDEGNPHTSTCGWYTVDACGMGTDDLTGARVDINP